MTRHFFGDTAVLLGRSLRHITRSLDTIITTTIMPIAFMLLFVYVFGGAIQTGSGKYVNYLLPGILLITIASGISYTAYRLFLDMQSGILERFQSMPIARSSVLWAHVLTSLVANVISLVVVVLVALLMGFRSGAGALAWLAVVGILMLFTLALTWLAVIPGLSARSVDGASAFSYPAVRQLGLRAHREHARAGAGLRREPAGDIHRERDPRPVRTAAGQHRHLDRPRLVPRPSQRRVRLGHRHLPSQDQLMTCLVRAG
jgi:ABC-2 type transport system permease protein